MQNITHTKKDTFVRSLTFKDEADAPINITGSTIKFTMKTNIDDVTPLLQEDGTITDAPNGLAEVKVDAGVMDFDTGTYYYDIQWTDSAGIVRTVLKGNFVITYEITT